MSRKRKSNFKIKVKVETPNGSKWISKAAAWRLARMARRLDNEHLAALREQGLV
jgi:hypothetical protein